MKLGTFTFPPLFAGASAGARAAPQSTPFTQALEFEQSNAFSLRGAGPKFRVSFAGSCSRFPADFSCSDPA